MRFPSQKSWHIVVRNGHTLSQVRFSRWAVQLAVLLFIAAIVSASALVLVTFTQKRTIDTLNNDLLSAGQVVELLKVSLPARSDSNLDDLNTFNETLATLRKNHQLPPLDPTETRQAIQDKLSGLQDQFNNLRHEKDQVDLLLSLMTSEISGNRKTRKQLEQERSILLERISNLEKNLEYQTTKSTTLVSSLQTVLERISGVVGLPVLLDSDAVLTADAMANRLRTLFVSQSEILYRLTTETNKATIQARSIIEKAGFDPEKVIKFPLDIDSSLPTDQDDQRTSELTRLLPLVLDADVALDRTLGSGDLRIASTNEKHNELSALIQQLNSLSSDEQGADGDLQGQGGPYVPIDLLAKEDGAAGDIFTSQLFHLAYAVELYDAIDEFVACLPLGKPLEKGRLTSGYGYRRDPIIKGKVAFHGGIDLANRLGTNVSTTGSGRVVYAAWAGAFGRTVTIDHGCGFSTRYGHLHKINVKPGTPVVKGQSIGTVGSTGRSTGSHLHYEILFQGRHYNPKNILRVKHDLW